MASGPKVRKGNAEKIYKQHLMNIQNASYKTDNKAPHLPLSVYVKEANFYGDMFRLRNVELQNRDLLKNVNIIYRSKGKTDCQLEKYTRKKTMYLTEQSHLEKIRKRNEAFLEKIDLKNMKSNYSQEAMAKDWQRMLKVMKFSAKYPEFYDKKRSQGGRWSICPRNLTSDPKFHKVCFFDLRIGSLPKLFRVDIELYTDIVPGTAGNFVSLCRGFEGLSYKGSVLHRIVPGLMCVGGDIVNRSGTGGISIYGQYFSDENFLLQHNGPGVLAMYSTEPDKNNSQFLITFRKLSTLNNRYVVFGRIKSSLKTLELIESCGTKSGNPSEEVKVEDCGVYE